jgi:hypothetical protein
MNEFTKEELRWLITLCNQNQSGFVEFKHPLYVKLQSLIDNYCDHEHKQYYERVDIYECENCQMVML